MKLVSWLGLLGDLITFCGGLILAWDAWKGEKHANEAQKISDVLKSPAFARRIVVIKGVNVNNPDEIERAFLHITSKNARLGIAVLAVGFLFLLAHRIIDLIN